MSDMTFIPKSLGHLTSHSPWGSYLVKTSSGTLYKIVLAGAKSSLTRLPGRELSNHVHADPSTIMRGDGKTHQLAALNVAVGCSAEFFIVGITDDKITHRVTTRVEQITRV